MKTERQTNETENERIGNDERGKASGHSPDLSVDVKQKKEGERKTMKKERK